MTMACMDAATLGLVPSLLERAGRGVAVGLSQHSHTYAHVHAFACIFALIASPP